MPLNGFVTSFGASPWARGACEDGDRRDSRPGNSVITHSLIRDAGGSRQETSRSHERCQIPFVVGLRACLVGLSLSSYFLGCLRLWCFGGYFGKSGPVQRKRQQNCDTALGLPHWACFRECKGWTDLAGEDSGRSLCIPMVKGDPEQRSLLLSRADMCFFHGYHG